jgi:ribosome recycling factor
VQAARQACERASGAIRDSRGAMHKHLQDLQKKKIARADDVRKAHDRMEKLVEKGQKEAKDLLEGAKKGLEKA